VYERRRLTIRAEALVWATGTLEQREGVVNVLVSDVRRVERPDLPEATVRHIEPRRAWSNQSDAEANQLRAVAPAANSFARGRR
jgi:hypothetical protein